MRAARNKALDELRRQRARPQAATVSLENLERLSPSVHPWLENQVEKSWLRQHITQVLEAIPTEQHLCLELIYFGGLNHSEVAEQTHTPLGTIKTRICTGLNRVERLLRGVGYSEQFERN